MEFLDIVLERLARSIALDPSHLFFVDDTAVTYDPPRHVTVRRSDLFSVGDEGRLQAYLAGKHSWVHANLLTTQQGQHVISLRHGPASQRDARPEAANFAVNVSREPTPLLIED